MAASPEPWATPLPPMPPAPPLSHPRPAPARAAGAVSLHRPYAASLYGKIASCPAGQPLPGPRPSPSPRPPLSRRRTFTPNLYMSYPRRLTSLAAHLPQTRRTMRSLKSAALDPPAPHTLCRSELRLCAETLYIEAPDLPAPREHPAGSPARTTHTKRGDPP